MLKSNISTPNKPKSKSRAKDTDLLNIEREMSELFGHKIEIETKNKKAGKVSITYKTLDELDNIINKKDTFVIMPTGGGKSLCYQLPALISDGTAIVISPLIALMKNQVDAVRGLSEENSIAHVLNSSLSSEEVNMVKSDVKSKKTKLLYLAPESLAKASNAVLIGFNVKANREAKKIADEQKIEIKYFNIIYEAIEYIVDEFGVMNDGNSYVQFFLDFALDYSNKYQTGLNEFVTMFGNDTAPASNVS